ncbi:MAG TPA: hypothetical protein VNN77_08670 [candidate division Zixibacteria bacterium]|nr:hypothetical protein [candidate division Zixibacteria bacterium]
MIAIRTAERRLRLPERRQQGGYTFNELLVAIGIIAVAVLGYSLSTVGVIRGTFQSANATAAVHLGQDKIEELKSLRALANTETCPDRGDAGITGGGRTGGIFHRCWSVTDWPKGARLKQIVVKVWWRDHEDGEVVLTTLVFRE